VPLASDDAPFERASAPVTRLYPFSCFALICAETLDFADSIPVITAL
jgi:hypothetical protein